MWRRSNAGSAIEMLNFTPFKTKRTGGGGGGMRDEGRRE
jgi:hypothetical protein